MKDFITLVQEDWQKLPTTIRYFFYAGVVLILITWLGDHWSDKQQYHVPLFPSNEKAFQGGFWIIIGFFALLLIKQIDFWRRIFFLHRRYPIKKIDSDFHLVNLKGWIYLFDERRKERLHIMNPQTATDLWPLGEWLDVDISKDDPGDTEITLRNSKKIKLGDYRNNPAGINTR